jgi:DNA-binding transcriptional ArsR family regulator
MDTVKIAAALSNTTRMDIMRWLNDPDAHFTPHVLVDGFGMGVCVGKIHEKSGLSQSTISHYLSILQNADLLLATRIGKWTYYKSNKVTIENYLNTLKSEI